MRTSLKAKYLLVVLMFGSLVACTTPKPVAELEARNMGPYSVGSTNLEIASEFADIGDDRMHNYLLGIPSESGESQFLVDILKNPDATWITNVLVPDEPDLYGPVSGETLPVVTYITYPTASGNGNRYSFPFHNAQYGTFEHMLRPGEKPAFADPEQQYPLILLSHGTPAHGIYDVGHAHSLSSHGYIVAVMTYGDLRIENFRESSGRTAMAFLRPLLTSSVLDSILESDTFGPHIDADNIGISGHSVGGFTALAIAGGHFMGDARTVHDERIKAGVLAAPMVGHSKDGEDVFVFGPDNGELSRVTAPMLCVYGSKDEATPASYILPAIKKLSGPTYVVELVDQPHVFEDGSWQDRDNWELLFFSAYLKNDPGSLESLRTSRSMEGGNEDIQLFEYQRVAVP